MPSHVSVLKNKRKINIKNNKKIENGQKSTEKQSTDNDTHEGDADPKVFVVKQEIKFARCLAGNDPKVRTRVLKNLKKWLKLRSQGSFAFTDTDFLRLWKGLWYCMWMSDKPLAQEKLCEDLASLTHCFDNPSVGLQFFGNFLATMSREWFGIDQWRMDKFMMLVRRVLRQTLILLHKNDWEHELVEKFGDWLAKTVYDESKCPVGLIMHFNDLYLEEISKVTEGEIDPEHVHNIIEPCILFFAKCRDMRLIKHTKRNIFYKLLMQSEMGQEYQEKFDIWKRANFPCTSIDDLDVEVQVEEESNQGSDEENDAEPNASEEKSLDVRAGRVNVVLEEIKFDPKKIIELFEKYRFKEFTNAKSRRNIKEIILKYRKFADGEFPLGIRKVQTVQEVASSFEKFDAEDKALELMDYEEQLAASSVNLPERVKRKLEWKRKRMLALNDTQEDKSNEKESNGNGTSDWIEEDIGDKNDNDENEQPKKKIAKTIKKDKSSEKQTVTTKKDKKMKKKDLKKTETDKHDSTFEEAAQNLIDEWSKPLEDGEVELFLPSRKKKLAEANTSLQKSSNGSPKTPKNKGSLVLNPFASAPAGPNKSGKKQKLKGKNILTDIKTPEQRSHRSSFINSGEKRVKIALNKNMVQDTHEYIAAVKNSPQVPYDSAKKPTKGLLKPNLLPSPINPFYKKRIGLKFNDTL